MRRSIAIRSVGPVLLPLVVGFALSSGAIFGFAAIVGDATAPSPYPAALAVAVAVILMAFAAIDLVPVTVRRSVCERQTPQLAIRRYPPSIGGFIWGFDTGSLVSTYRYSMAGWAALALCLSGWGAPWIGLLYAIGFCIPLVAFIVSWGAERAPAWLRPTTDTFDLVGDFTSRARASRWLSAGMIIVSAVIVVTASV